MPPLVLRYRNIVAKRALAAFVDWAPLLLVLRVLGLVRLPGAMEVVSPVPFFYPPASVDTDSFVDVLEWLAAMLPFLAVAFADLVLLPAYVGCSLGMLVAGVRVVGPDGCPKPGLGRMLSRVAWGIPDHLCFGLVGLVAMATNGFAQRFGDRGAQVYVVDRDQAGTDPRLGATAR